MLNRIVIAVLLFAAGAGTAWYYKSIVAVSQVSPATASAPEGGDHAVQVVTDKVTIGPVVETYEALGTAFANEAVTLTAKVTGNVKSVNFDEGQMAKKGDVLVELDDREERATLAQSEAELRNAKLLLERAQQLIKSQNVPQARVDELLAGAQGSASKVEAARARLADLKIVAPFDGRLGLRRVSVGSLISQNTTVTTLDDLSVIKLDFTVPETMLSKIGVGRTVTTHNDVFPGERFKGVVKTIDSRIDAATRSIQVRAEVPNPGARLKPGMLMTVELPMAERPNAMTIAESALVPEGSEQYVYKIVDGRAVKTSVKLGSRIRGNAEILSGLTEADDVVIGGVQKVRNGTRVKASQQTAEKN
ncbi:MAG TPA: efflux RND transporter periplasmic adaptor subunit [Alphaproteobacteria bacterium]|jgi:membrane fusion protein (multidrug efflux system)